MRDLTYVMAGIIILLSGKYAYGIDVINFLEVNFGFSGDLFKLILFLIISYFVGLIIKEAFVFKYIDDNKWYRKCWFDTLTPNIDGYGVDGSLRLKRNIQINFGSMTSRNLERTVYFYHVSASIGISSFISFLLLVFSQLINFNSNIECSFITKDPSCETVIITIIMLFVWINCIYQNNTKWDEYIGFLKDLDENLVNY